MQVIPAGCHRTRQVTATRKLQRVLLQHVLKYINDSRLHDLHSKIFYLMGALFYTSRLSGELKIAIIL
jgi:hypothetical protein